MADIDVSLLRLAAAQERVVTRAQAGAIGLSRAQVNRRMAGGVLTGLHPSVYLLPGRAPSYDESLVAAVLACGDRAAVSHRSAVALWRLGPAPTRPALTVVGTGRPRLRGVEIHRTDRLETPDLARVGRFNVTSPARTLLDAGSVLTVERLEAVVERAVHTNLVSFRALREMIDRLGGHGRRGTAALRAILDARDPAMAPTESELESAFELVVVRFDLPRPTRQHRLLLPGFGVVRLDFAYVPELVAVEMDGRIWHAGRVAFERDRVRGNALARAGWMVLRFTATDVRRRPREVADEVLSALATRSLARSQR